MKVVRFPAGGYEEGVCVYLIEFGDRSVYVGKTRSANDSGTSKPYERIATHLKKRGKTRSALFDHEGSEVRRKGDLSFVFEILPDEYQDFSAFIEYCVDRAIAAKRMTRHNDPIRRPHAVPTGEAHDAAVAWSLDFVARALAELANGQGADQ